MLGATLLLWETHAVILGALMPGVVHRVWEWFAVMPRAMDPVWEALAVMSAMDPAWETPAMMPSVEHPLLLKQGQNRLTHDLSRLSGEWETTPEKKHVAVLEHSPHLLAVLPHPKQLPLRQPKLNRQGPWQAPTGFQLQGIAQPAETVNGQQQLLPPPPLPQLTPS